MAKGGHISALFQIGTINDDEFLHYRKDGAFEPVNLKE
jgi:hypothetical protein